MKTNGHRVEYVDLPPPGWSFICDHKIVAPKMLVKGLLPYRGVAFIGGQSGAGKTFIASYLSASLSSATPFFGHAVKERVGVAIIAAEGTEQAGNRLTAAAKAQGLDISDLPIAWRGGAPLKSAKDVDAIGKQLEELGAHIQQQYRVRLGVAILDTVAATFDMEDEDSNSEVAKAIKKMRDLGDKFRGLVIPIHHYGKSATTGLRGASAWRAGADVVLSVIANRKEQTGEITGRELALAKARDGIEGPIAPFALTFAELGLDEDGEPFGTCIVEPRYGEPSLSAEKKAREPASHRVFRDAFVEAVDTCGQTIRIRNDGPEVRAVDIMQVRAQFNHRYATAEPDPAKRKDAQRKAFKRAIDDLARQYPTWSKGDVEMMWSITGPVR